MIGYIPIQGKNLSQSRTYKKTPQMGNPSLWEVAVERICVRMPNWVGDVVMATPLLRALRRRFPGAHIALVIRERVLPVLKRTPWFDDILVYRPDAMSTALAFLGAGRALAHRRFDLGLVLPNSFSSALMFWMGRVRVRVGYARDLRSPLLTDAVPRPQLDGAFRPTYMADYYLGLARAVGIPDVGNDTELFFTDEDMARALQAMEDEGIEPDRPMFLMHAGAGYGPSKHWPADRFARLADLLAAEYGAQIGLVGGPSTLPLHDAIAAAAGCHVVDLAGGNIDLHLLKCVVVRSRLLVTTDSGPRHYGVALGVPTVCIMGPTHPDYSTSTRPNDHVVRVDVDCGPCQKKSCPRDHRCMEDITPQIVFDACRDALRLQPSRGISEDDKDREPDEMLR